MHEPPPTAPWSARELGQLLCDAGQFDDPTPRLEKAGDGNINWVRRVRSENSGKTLIIKHAGPRLERFPEYRADPRRIETEYRYYELARSHDPDGVCPEVRHFDRDHHLLVLEDLGDAERLDRALGRSAELEQHFAALGRFLARIHTAFVGKTLDALHFPDSPIRELHGDHIFVLPYRANDFPLPCGLEERARRVREDPDLGAIAQSAYRRFQEKRETLVHADVQPANILLAPRGPILLDAEIAHCGDPAFDLGTLIAHPWITHIAAGEPERAGRQTRAAWEAYRDALVKVPPPPFDEVALYAALEMVRRTIGAARVDAVHTATSSIRVLDTAERWLRQPPHRPEEMELG